MSIPEAQVRRWAREARAYTGTTELTRDDVDHWVCALIEQPRLPGELLPWLQGPLQWFFPHGALFMGHGELVAGQIKVTHSLAHGHDPAYLQQLATSFELEQRGSLAWWIANRQPFLIDPQCPPDFATSFELEEIRQFDLGRVAAHGVLGARSTVGTYFSFAGIAEPLTAWHEEALVQIAPVLNNLFLDHIADTDGPNVGLLAPLTPAQKVLVREVVTGCTNKEIGRTLGLSEKTVSNRLTEIYERLRVSCRAELVALVR